MIADLSRPLTATLDETVETTRSLLDTVHRESLSRLTDLVTASLSSGTDTTDLGLVDTLDAGRVSPTEPDRDPLRGPVPHSSDAPVETAGQAATIGLLSVLIGWIGRPFLLVPGSLSGTALVVAQSLMTIGPIARLGSLRYWRWRVLSVFRYSRHDDSDPLDHEHRATLYGHIQDSPGIHLSALSDETDILLSTARYHLRILEYEGLIHAEKINGHRRYTPSRDHDATRPVVHSDARRSLIDALAANGPQTVSALADALDRDPSTVTHHLQRLAERGLIDRHRDGRRVVNGLAPALQSPPDRAAVEGRPEGTAD